MSFGPKPWKDRPDGSTPISAAGLMDLEARLAAYSEANIPAAVTLPGSPREGEQVDLLLDDGLYRLCTWREAANGGNGAWIVAGGGPPLTWRYAGSAISTSSTGWVDITGDIMSLLPGRWSFSWGAIHRNSGASNFSHLRPSVVTAADVDRTSSREQTQEANSYQRMSRTIAETFLVESVTAIHMRARVTAGSSDFLDIDCSAFPIEFHP